ncbi:YetF domain-containing protein [Bacillus sp. JJ1521]|uniref:YetF domain-containing protein n=1 Tax=Bacillus sp. JJ1521 TaxID=3122957 RepID=UPI003F68A8A5
MDIPELVLRIFLGFIILFSLTRILGRKEISQMTFFNFVSAIAIGSIAANWITTKDFSILNGILALGGWALFTLFMSFIDIKSKSARKITTGDPIIIIKNGKIMDHALKKSRLDIDTLNAMLRQENVFSMADVDYAIFETNGMLSVLKKEGKQSLTKSDMNIAPAITKIYPIPTGVISDGKIITKNLSKLNLTQNWLDHQPSQAGITSPSDVMYAEVQQDGSLFIDNKGHILH